MKVAIVLLKAWMVFRFNGPFSCTVETFDYAFKCSNNFAFAGLGTTFTRLGDVLILWFLLFIDELLKLEVPTYWNFLNACPFMRTVCVFYFMNKSI